MQPDGGGQVGDFTRRDPVRDADGTLAERVLELDKGAVMFSRGAERQKGADPRPGSGPDGAAEQPRCWMIGSDEEQVADRRGRERPAGVLEVLEPADGVGLDDSTAADLLPRQGPVSEASVDKLRHDAAAVGGLRDAQEPAGQSGTSFPRCTASTRDASMVWVTTRRQLSVLRSWRWRGPECP